MICRVMNRSDSLFSSVFLSLLMNAHDDGDDDMGGEHMPTRVGRADKISAATPVTILCGHKIKWGVTVRDDRLAALGSAENWRALHPF